MKINVVKLKTTLFQKGIRQWQLAQAVGIHETNLSKIIVGRLEPSEELVSKICNALKVRKSELIDG